MEIRKLDPAVYAGRKFTARYRTNGYYAILPCESGFQMRYTAFEAPVEKSFDDEFFGEWLEHPVAYGAFEGDRLVGYVEGAIEGWNNRRPATKTPLRFIAETALKSSASISIPIPMTIPKNAKFASKWAKS